MRTIFVVDDEENIRHIISTYLMRDGFQVESFASVEETMLRLQSTYPDMFILDIMLPGRDGLDFCREVRNRSGVPVIFISSRDEEVDRILGLEIGGDDYLSKPFSPRELVARVRSLFRRSSLASPESYTMNIDNLTIFPTDRRILVNAQEIMLTPKEYEMLLLLVEQPQRTFTRQELLDRVWGFDYVGGARAVDDLIKRLRKKLRENGADINIKTIWGLGYRLHD